MQVLTVLPGTTALKRRQRGEGGKEGWIRRIETWEKVSQTCVSAASREGAMSLDLSRCPAI